MNSRLPTAVGCILLVASAASAQTTGSISGTVTLFEKQFEITVY